MVGEDDRNVPEIFSMAVVGGDASEGVRRPVAELPERDVSEEQLRVVEDASSSRSGVRKSEG